MFTSSGVREPAVAGSFYPRSPEVLRSTIQSFFDSVSLTQKKPGLFPRAVIAPHAGYVYSGPVAASVFKNLQEFSSRYQRVIIVGPSHRVPFKGMALPEEKFFQTPLGQVSIDPVLSKQLKTFSQVLNHSPAHEKEHCIEVQLPFLQMIFSHFSLVPLLVGWASPQEVASVMSFLLEDSTNLLLVSSDLSHYLSYEKAQQLDEESLFHIEHLSPLTEENRACGSIPINGLIEVARERNLKPQVVDARNSGDTSGHRDQVVGYAGILFWGKNP